METVQEEERQGGKRTRRLRLYPADTLEESVEIAKAIYDKSGGQPIDRIMLAKAIGRTPASSAFRSLIASSAKYGITIGNYNDPEIKLTPLGEAVVGAQSIEERTNALRQAALKPEIFNSFYAKLDGKKFPETEYAENMLRRQLKVASELSKECLSIIRANGEYVGLITSVKGSLYITMRGTEVGTGIQEQPQVEVETTEETGIPSIPIVEEARIFISHSKNKRILGQVKTMLEFGKYQYEVAEETETTAIPVHHKILEAMRRCNAAIINVSADEQELLENGRYGINQNVLIEIGTAFVLYDKKVVLLVDKRVDLPSNLQGLYKCEYKGDELSWEAGLKLQKTITDFQSETDRPGE